MTKIFGYLGIFALVMMSLSTPVYAYVKSNDTIIIREDEVIDDDFFAAGDEITIEGTINGDVYVGANRLTIRGTVNGDVIGAASNIEVTGRIRDDLRVAGNNITLIGAEIGDSVSVASNDLSIDQDTTVGGGLIFGGRNLTIDGSVGRGITTGSESTRIDGAVGRTVRVAATNITIDSDAVIDGNLEYKSDNEANIRGEITGTVQRGEGGGFNLDTESIARWFIVGYNAWAFVGAAIIGALMMLLMPRMFLRANKKLFAKPGRVAGIGAITLLIALPVLVLLAATIFGIPLAVVALIAWLLGIYFAKFFVSFSLGRFLLAKVQNETQDKVSRMYLALLFGLAIYYLLRIIPGIGLIVRLATTVIGLGMLLSLYKKPSKQLKT